jgi:hypothetical protein
MVQLFEIVEPCFFTITTIVFVRCQANGSVHALARAALSHASRSTFNVTPNCIATIVMNEIPQVNKFYRVKKGIYR